jgi:hypothetical protein
LLATLIPNTNETDKGSTRSQAVLTYCALVGAIGDQYGSRRICQEEFRHECANQYR